MNHWALALCIRMDGYVKKQMSMPQYVILGAMLIICQ